MTQPKQCVVMIFFFPLLISTLTILPSLLDPQVLFSIPFFYSTSTEQVWEPQHHLHHLQ